MFLGIRFNIWHGILAVAGIALGALVISALLPDAFREQHEGLAFLATWLFAALCAFASQCAYELKQLFAPDVVATYGSYEGFIADSKNDFKWFWRGALVSPIVTGLLFAHVF